MKKLLRVERLYSLGNYKNIKIVSELSEIPQEVLDNEKYMELLEFSLLLDTESSFHKYMKLLEDTEKYNSLDQARESIAELRSSNYDNIINLIKNGDTENEKGE